MSARADGWWKREVVSGREQREHTSVQKQKRTTLGDELLGGYLGGAVSGVSPVSGLTPL